MLRSGDRRMVAKREPGKIAAMKIRLLALAAAALSLPLAGAATKEPSLISAFAGPHNGSVNFAGFPGPTVGRFTASKKKESGTLTLQSSILQGSSTFGITELYTFNKRSATLTLSQGGSTPVVIPGFGRAKISKNKISYTITLSVPGSPSPAFIFGTMRLAKNHHLTVQETLSSSGTSAILLYQLDGKKPKK